MTIVQEKGSLPVKINPAKIKKFLGCDDAFFVQLMGKFTEESGEGMVKLKAASDSGNMLLVKMAAHKMLSSTRVFLLKDLSKLLEEIEMMSQDGVKAGEISAWVSAAEQEWKSILEEVKMLQQKP